MTQTIAPVGTTIPANEVQAGMVIVPAATEFCVPSRIVVDEVTTDGEFATLVDNHVRHNFEAAHPVTVLGYFNPDN